MVESKKGMKEAAKPALETVDKPGVKAEGRTTAPVTKDAKAVPAKKAAASADKGAAQKKAAAKKETSKAAAKKPVTRKREPKVAVHFQFDGKDLVAKEVLDQAVKAFKKSHRGVVIKTIELYIVANESAAYYVINGEADGNYKIML